MNSFNKRETALNRKASRIGSAFGAVSVGAMLMALPSIASAQDAAPPNSGEVVVITGIRASLAKSVNQKKNLSSIAEVISAEEIGKLPDSSIAESLARLPGIVGQRVNGDVQVLNIRGTSQDFTVTTLNGRQQGSLGDARGVEVDQYPSELMNGAVVYKTPDAAIPGMGLSGTVDLRTVRPLTVKGRQMVVNLRADTSTLDELNPDISKNGWRGSFSYVNQFMDGKLGVAFGIAHMDTTNQIQHQKLWGWIKAKDMPSWEGSSANFFPGGTTAQRDANILTGFELRSNSLNKVRDGALGVIEFRPNDSAHTTLDLYYSNMKQKEVVRDVEVNTFWTGDNFAGMTTSAAQISSFYGTPTVLNGEFFGMTPIQNNQLNTRDDSVLSVGLNHEQKVGQIELNFDVSYSKSEGDRMESEAFAGYGSGARAQTKIKFSIPENGFVTMTPDLNFADASKMNLGDSAPWGGWGADGHVRYPHVEDSYATYAFSMKAPLNKTVIGKWVDSVQLGVNGWHHEKDKDVREYDLFLKGDPTNAQNSNNRPVALSSTYGVGTTNLNWAGWGGLVAFDIQSALDNAYVTKEIADSNHFGKAWNVAEDVLTLFGKFNIETEIMGHRLRGNVGAQFVSTESESTGLAIITNNNGGNLTPKQVVAQNDYTDFLPSLNLVFDVTKDIKFRFGAAKQMARPRTDELRANFQAGLSALSSAEYLALGLTPPASGDAALQYYKPSGSGGNPYLDPWRADAYDFSAEYYLGRKSIVALSYFHKKVETYVYSQTIKFDFTGMPNPLGRKIVTNIGNYTTPENGKGGYIKGWEFQTSLDFGDLVPVLDGFGLTGNYTSNETDIRSNSGGNSPLPGFSGETWSLATFYEKNGFQARVSYSYRDATYSDVAGLFATRSFTSILENSHVDAQVGYEFQDGPMKGLAIQLQAYNLTNEPYETTGGNLLTSTTLLPETYEEYGTKYLFGVRYKF